MILKLPHGLLSSAPSSEQLTSYDRLHFLQYIKLLDAIEAGMEPEQMCRDILDLDPTEDSSQALATLNSHIQRAKWISESGFRQILSGKKN